MPLRDRLCPTCGWVKPDNYEPRTAMTVLCPEGHETTIVYVGSSFAVHGDDKFIGGKRFENMGDQPVTVYSRSEYKRELAARGLQEFVRHVDRADGEKPLTRKWV
jgi:hypothetical protein